MGVAASRLGVPKTSQPVLFGAMLPGGLASVHILASMLFGAISGSAGTSIIEVVRPLLPMYVAMALALIVVTFVPWLSLWLPSVFGF